MSWISPRAPLKDPGAQCERSGQPADDGLYIQRGEIIMMVVEPQPSGKVKIVTREEVRTGTRDTNADARGRLDDQSGLLRDAAAGNKTLRIEAGGRNITERVDLASDAVASKSTRGPAGKGFDKSLGVSASDLEALCKELLAAERAAAKGAP